MIPLAKRVLDRLRDERGMALIMAVGIATVLSVAGTSVILYSTSNEHHATRSRADLDAYTLAQAGVNNAVAQLGTIAPINRADPTKYPCNAASATHPGRPFTTDSCRKVIGAGTVNWTGELWDDCHDATSISYQGCVDSDAHLWRWHVIATASVPSPSSPGQLVTRTVTAEENLVPNPSQPINADAWNYVYSKKNDHSGTGGCDETVYNNTTLNTSMYVNGNLCFEQSSQIVGPATPGTDPPVYVIVKGWTDMTQNNAFMGWYKDSGSGSRYQPITKIWMDGGCKSKVNATLHPASPTFLPCGAVDNIWALDGISKDPTGPPAPPNQYYDAITGNPVGNQHADVVGPIADFPDWYRLASPGPKFPCNGGLVADHTYATNYPVFDTNYPANDNSQTVLDLTPNFKYDCKTVSGELKWDPATKQLYIKGSIYYDGSAQINGVGTIDYTGIGALYLSGWFYMRQSSLCGNTSGTGCDFAHWNYTDNIMVIVANGDRTPTSPGIGIELDQSTYQGAFYATNSIQIGSSSDAQGPMVALKEVIRNQSSTTDFPQFIKVPFGTPGNKTTLWDLTAPVNYTG